MLNFLIADDQEIARIVLRYTLSDAFENPYIKEHDNGEDLLQDILQNKWDIIITDITMPKKNGIEVLEELAKLNIKIPVLVFSGHLESEYGVKAMKLGASGFANKLILPDELVKIVKILLSGKKYIPETLLNLIEESNINF